MLWILFCANSCLSLRPQWWFKNFQTICKQFIPFPFISGSRWTIWVRDPPRTHRARNTSRSHPSSVLPCFLSSINGVCLYSSIPLYFWLSLFLLGLFIAVRDPRPHSNAIRGPHMRVPIFSGKGVFFDLPMITNTRYRGYFFPPPPELGGSGEGERAYIGIYMYLLILWEWGGGGD